MTPLPPRFAHALVALAASMTVWLAAPVARADTVTINQITVTRPAGSSSFERPAITADWINYDDCLGDVQIQFSVSASPSTGFVGYASLDGVDCSTSAARTTAGSACCQIASSYPANGVVTVNAQTLVTCLMPNVTGCDDTTSSGPNAVTISFTVNDGASAGDVATLAATQSIDLALRAPDPPGEGLSATAGDGEITIALPARADANTLGYLVYCLPATDAVAAGSSASGSAASGSSASSGAPIDAGSPDASGAGGSANGGAGGGSASASACPQYAIPGVDPLHPDPSSKYLCDNLGAPAISLSFGNLVNGVDYVVAIAAYDQAANVGSLSVPQCATPEPTNTFFGAYCRAAGGKCGGCDVRAVGADDARWPAIAVAGLAAAWLSARRRARAAR